MVYHNDNPMETHPVGAPARITRQHSTDILTTPWKEILTLQHDLNVLVGRLLGVYGLHETASEGQPGQPVCVEPDVDIHESAEDYILRIALPGIEPEAIQVHATSHRITLTAQANTSADVQMGAASEQAAGPQGETRANDFVTVWQLNPIQQPHLCTQHHQSRYSVASRFAFEYTLLEEIVPEQAQARLRHGRLDLYLPKLKPGIEQSVRVEIQDRA